MSTKGNRKKILLLVDHKWRDLPSYTYLALHLEKLGHDVFMCRLGYEKFVIPSYEPNLVIFNCLYDPQLRDYLASIKQYGVKVGVMLTEGEGFYAGEDDFISGKYNDLSIIDLQFAWNEDVKNRMRKHSSIKTEHIYAAGVPRFDFFQPPLRNLMMSKNDFCAKYKLDPSKPIITWTTNYGVADFIDSLDIEWLRAVNAKYKIDSLDAYRDTERLAQSDYDSRMFMTAMMERLADELGDRCNIAIKHHPVEVLTHYENLVEKIRLKNKNVTLVTEEYIWDVINATDILIQRSCTTGLEGWFLDKPTIECRNKFELFDCDEIFDGHDVAFTYEEFKNSVMAYLNNGCVVGSEKKTRRRQILKNWFFESDGNRTYEHAKLIDSFLKKSADQRVRIPWKKEFAKEKIKNSIRKMAGIPYYKPINLVGYLCERAKAKRVNKSQRFITEEDIVVWRNRLSSYMLNRRG